MRRGRMKQDIIGKHSGTANLVREIVGDRTYCEVANKIDIDPSTLSYICRGKVKPTLDVIVKLCSISNGITVNDFINVQ